MVSLHIGTSGLELSDRKGHLERLFYPAGRSKKAGTKDFDELRFYASTSTPSR
jgi:hypothetical protein